MYEALKMLFSTIISPEPDGIIEEGSYYRWLESINNCYNVYDLSVKYRNIKTSNNTHWKNFHVIEDKDYMGQRDLYNLINAYSITKYSKPDILCFLDVDTFLVKPIEFEEDIDFDIAFTIKERGRSHVHTTNMGSFFVNLKKDNKKTILDFFVSNIIDTRVLDKAGEGSVNFWKYISFPEIKGHIDYLDDYIVQQDYVNSICFAKQWFEPGLYDLNGLKIRLLDERYNRFWYFDEPYNPDTYIYHFKGVRENKLERVKKLKALHDSYKK